MPYDARTYKKVDVPGNDVYYCYECKLDRQLQWKMYCWICSVCRIVLIDR